MNPGGTEPAPGPGTAASPRGTARVPGEGAGGGGQRERSRAARPLAAAAVHHSSPTNSNARLCGAKGGRARPRLGQSRGRRWAAPPPRRQEGGAKMAAMGGPG